ncbi:hypothetical protein D3C78_911970 [compost metagenome]
MSGINLTKRPEQLQIRFLKQMACRQLARRVDTSAYKLSRCGFYAGSAFLRHSESLLHMPDCVYHLLESVGLHRCLMIGTWHRAVQSKVFF